MKPDVIETFKSDVRSMGVGEETIRVTLVVLQGAFRSAVLWGRISRNPVLDVSKPSRRRTRVVRPLHPHTVEMIRSALLGRGLLRDATLVSVLAYAGIRPGEALALIWVDVGERRLVVDKAIALGQPKATKTGRNRTVRLLGPLAQDLNVFRMASGRPDDTALVFPRRDGRPWTDFDYRNWRRRVFYETLDDLKLPRSRPYDLRHSFASLLFAEGVNPAEIAEEMGHSLQMLLSTYTHVLEELRGKPKVDSEAVIREARAGDVTQKSPRAERR